MTMKFRWSKTFQPRFFFFYVLIKKTFHQMAKYLDQAGAQYLAEALMGSTKTIGGQTIWGSGNIEAGGSNTITINTLSDFDTYQSKLSDDSYKTVILNSALYEADSDNHIQFTICNAIILCSQNECVFSSGGSEYENYITFINCTTVPYGTNLTCGMPAPCLRFLGTEMYYHLKVSMINCNMGSCTYYLTDGDTSSDPFADVVWSSTFTFCDVWLQNSIFQSFNNVVKSDGDTGYMEQQGYTVDVDTNWHVEDSTLIGLKTSSCASSSLNLAWGTLNNWINVLRTYKIRNYLIGCDLSGFGSGLTGNISDARNFYSTYFLNCTIPTQQGDTHIYNCDRCIVADGDEGKIYYGPYGSNTALTNGAYTNIVTP